MLIVSLGQTACRLADKFSIYPDYKIYRVDHDIPKGKQNLKIPHYDQSYEYENEFPQDKLEKFFGKLKGEVLFVTCGSEPTSLLSLRILEILTKSCIVSICYIRLDKLLIGQDKKEIEKMVFETLQNFTLSAYLKQMYVFDNTLVEKMCQDINVFNYYDKVYEMVAWILNTNYSLKQQKNIFGNLAETREMGIKSFSVGDLHMNNRSGFLLDNVSEERIYYIISENIIQENKQLFDEIRGTMKLKEEGNKKICYAVYKSEMDEGLVLTEQQSMVYQK